MSEGQQVSFFGFYRWRVPVFFLLLLGVSCTTPKNYQKDKPFVYKTNIALKTDLPPAKKTDLKVGLENQLDDSLKVRTVLAIGWRPPFFYYRLSKPPVFDTVNIDRSKTFMTALLNANGYLNPVITDTFKIDTLKRDQYRATVNFLVNTGKVFRLDSVGYDLRTPELQQLALQNLDKTLLKKGDPYSLQKVSAELDRLLSIYRDHGYYKISKEDIFAERDTVVAALIDPTIDPFEQARLLEELNRRRENPTMTVVIKQRPVRDTTRLEKFYIGNVTVYPDMSILEDSSQVMKDSAVINGYKIFYNSRRFKLPFIARNIALKPGELYRQSNYFKTINTFTNFGAWQQVDIDLFERFDTLPLLDARLRLYPSKKLSLNMDFETSRNSSDALTTGSLFGIGFVIGIRNKNAFRESIETTTNLRFGVELGTNIIQTAQTSLSHNIVIKRFLKPFRIRNAENPRTIINVNGAYTDRRQFFTVQSVNASLRYDWSVKNNTFQLYPFSNVEFTNVIKTDSLKKLEEKIPSLKYAFNNGLIISDFIAAYTKQITSNNHDNFFRTRIESSGAIFGLVKEWERGNLRRFLRADVEFKHFINYAKSTWAFRAFGGYGYVYGKTGNEPEYNLPFFKAFFAGGPYSMRAWQVRRLGVGSSILYDTLKTDRFGDMQLEANVEYRFNLATLAGIKVKSALFVDMGNIWAKTFHNNVRVEEADFKLSRLYQDLAVGAGTSLRFDFDFFIIRLDWAYKLKNPVFANQSSGWFQELKVTDGQFQLGIGYPF